MTIQDEQSVVSTQTQDPVAVGQPVVSSSVQTRRVTATPDGSETARRIIVLVFGLIQLVIGLRILLLIVDARTGNGIVSGILNISQVFVGPFEGILKTDALHSGGSMLDVAAVVAFVGWTVIEMVVFWVLSIFRRDTLTA
jgi:YGGT family